MQGAVFVGCNLYQTTINTLRRYLASMVMYSMSYIIAKKLHFATKPADG